MMNDFLRLLLLLLMLLPFVPCWMLAPLPGFAFNSEFSMVNTHAHAHHSSFIYLDTVQAVAIETMKILCFFSRNLVFDVVNVCLSNSRSLSILFRLSSPTQCEVFKRNMKETIHTHRNEKYKNSHETEKHMFLLFRQSFVTVPIRLNIPFGFLFIEFGCTIKNSLAIYSINCFISDSVYYLLFVYEFLSASFFFSSLNFVCLLFVMEYLLRAKKSDIFILCMQDYPLFPWIMMSAVGICPWERDRMFQGNRNIGENVCVSTLKSLCSNSFWRHGCSVWNGLFFVVIMLHFIFARQWTSEFCFFFLRNITTVHRHPAMSTTTTTLNH